MKYVDMSDDDIDFSNNIEAINNSISNILYTKKGSIPGNPTVGCDIERFLFEKIDPLTTSLIKEELTGAFNKWENRVTIEDILIDEDPDYNNLIVDVVFRLKDFGDLNTIDNFEETHSYQYILNRN